MRKGRLPCQVLSLVSREGGHEYSIASGNNMHGRVFIDQIAGYDDMIQLIPFSLILVGSGIVQDMGIGKKIVELAGFPDFRRFFRQTVFV